MRYALVGNNDGPLRLFKAVKSAAIELPVFIGLQKKPDPELLKAYQRELGLIPFFTGFDESLLIELLATQKPEVLINCFCNFKFTGLLKLYTCYNVHPSYLPYYRGRHPMHWALINGEKSHGISLHKMNADYDAGAIIWQKEVMLGQDQSVAILRERLMQKLEEDFAEVLRGIISNYAKSIENKLSEGNYWPPRKPEDSRITQWNDSEHIYRLIKALTSEAYPAYLLYNRDKKLVITDVKIEATGRKTPEHPKLLEQHEQKLVLHMPDNYLLHLYFNPEAGRIDSKIDIVL